MDMIVEFRGDKKGNIAKIAFDLKPGKLPKKKKDRVDIQRIFGSGDVGKKALSKMQGSVTLLKAVEVKKPDDLGRARAHPLKGNLTGYWAFDINSTWRVIFKWGKEHGLEKGLYDVYIDDYHENNRK